MWEAIDAWYQTNGVPTTEDGFRAVWGGELSHDETLILLSKTSRGRWFRSEASMVRELCDTLLKRRHFQGIPFPGENDD